MGFELDIGLSLCNFIWEGLAAMLISVSQIKFGSQKNIFNGIIQGLVCGTWASGELGSGREEVWVRYVVYACQIGIGFIYINGGWVHWKIRVGCFKWQDWVFRWSQGGILDMGTGQGLYCVWFCDGVEIENCSSSWRGKRCLGETSGDCGEVMSELYWDLGRISVQSNDRMLKKRVGLVSTPDTVLRVKIKFSRLAKQTALVVFN